MSKRTRMRLIATAAVVMAGAMPGLASAAKATADPASIEHGRYLLTIMGCNDCHTPGYLISEGQVPETLWLVGSTDMGWRGPWGTTYPPNLRLFVGGMTENDWVKVARTLKRRPPMPWFNLNTVKEADLRDIYRFIVSLPGGKGTPAPAFVPPGQEPKTPYASFPSPPPPK
jgi:mono/diheme cytochrome c family protein